MLFIKVENNQPVNHPVTLENLQMIYRDFDSINPPDGYTPFNRSPTPAYQGPYTVYDAKYVIAGNVVNEVYESRELSDTEKQELINE